MLLLNGEEKGWTLMHLYHKFSGTGAAVHRCPLVRRESSILSVKLQRSVVRYIGILGDYNFGWRC